MPATAAPETREFKTELKQLLHLITHSLYSNPEIFLRELISNASDAIHKVKFDALSHPDRLEGDADWKIKLKADKAAGTLTISDNGIGMTAAEVAENLGTIAKSGTKAFLEQLKAQEAGTRPDLIGQFGVGFYSAFMVADTVTVLTRPAGGGEATRWASDGQGEYTIEPAEKAGRGTDVTLHLKADAKDYLEEWRLKSIVRKFSDFLEHPVVMDVEREQEAEEGKEPVKEVVEETLNSQKALWLRNKSEVKPDEYAAFYKQITHHTDEPARVIHYNVEGAQEFRVLAFVPRERPFGWQFGGDEKHGLKLYIQRVLIMDPCEQLLPSYLRFVKGVVDSADLPLNISRELLQKNPQLDKIQRNVVGNVLDGLAAMKNVDYDTYVGFYKEFGQTLKEGVGRDWTHRDKLNDLLLFETSNTPAGEYRSLEQYVGAMPEGQADILYLSGESREALMSSPYLELPRQKGYDVLLFVDPIDEFMLPGLGEYKGKKLAAVDRADLPLEGTATLPESQELYKPLLEAIKGKLADAVSDVRLSQRLTDSAACLVADKHAMSAHMERLMKKWGRLDDREAGKRILELNPTHPAVQGLRSLYGANAEDARVEEYARLLLDQAVLAEGSKLPDPAAFAKRVNALIAKDLAG